MIKYVVGGTVQAGDGIYIERRADEDLFALCKASTSYGYVLTAYQMGKSSLMIRTAQKLDEVGIRSVVIDLSEIGEHDAEEEWYYSLLYNLEAAFQLADSLRSWWQEHTHLGSTQRFARCLETVLLSQISGHIVIFIDEIQMILRLPPFTDGFLAVIRSMYNARAVRPALKRLSFILIGTATPNDFISNPQHSTPFNIGQGIELTDFTPKEALPLAEGLGPPNMDKEQVLNWILKWTCGHPYLTLRLCANIAAQNRYDWSEQVVNDLVAKAFFSEPGQNNVHFRRIEQQLSQEKPPSLEMLTLYEDIRCTQQPIRDDAQSPIIPHLKLTGIVYPDKDGWLRVRNPIYEKVFDDKWIKARLREEDKLYQIWLVYLQSAVAQWQKKGKDHSTLLRGALLSEAKENLNKYAEHLSQDQKDFIAASIKHSEAEATEREGQAIVLEQTNARLRQRTALLSVVGVMAVLLATMAIWFGLESTRNDAIAQVQAVAADHQGAIIVTQEAEAQMLKATAEAAQAEVERLTKTNRSLQLAAQTIAERNQPDDELALLQAIESGRAAHTVEAFEALHQALAHRGDVSTALSEQATSVWRAVWNADRTRILTVEFNRVEANQFEPVDEYVDSTVRVWDAETGAELVTLSGHGGAVWQAIWNADETHILTASDDGTARVWDAETGAALVTLAGHTAPILSAIWNADETRILTTGFNDTIQVWDAKTGEELATLSGYGHTAWVTRAVWNAAGTHILTASSDGTAGVWDAETGDELITLFGHTDPVNQAIWNADETRILTASSDGTARVWDAETGVELFTLSGHRISVTQAVWNADETRILTVGGDGVARVWDVESEAELFTLSKYTTSVWQAVWNADETRILTVNTDGTARVWDAEDGAKLFTISEAGALVNQATWSDEGARILTISDDGTIRQYYARMSDLLKAACQRASRNMTWDEWQRYMGQVPYLPTCLNLHVHISFTRVGSNLAKSGDINGAMILFEQTLVRDPNWETISSAVPLNEICWFGSLAGQVAEVLDACEKAVALAQDTDYIRDSRGLARALTGDYAGAIEDFQFYIDLGSQNRRPEEKLAQRRNWIEKLKAGQNPFDQATLERLLNE